MRRAMHKVKATALLLGLLSLNPSALLAATCDASFNVGSGQTFSTIQAAVNSAPVSLSSNTCIVIKTAQTYNEQVTIQGKAMNNFRITIMKDPVLTSHPVVNPPANSTAAFQIMNASVSIQEIDIVPTFAIDFGIDAASDNITISTVNVIDPSITHITDSGIFSSGINSAIYASSAVVSNVNGIGIGSSAQFNSIFNSTMVMNNYVCCHDAAALMLKGSSGTVTGNVITNINGVGIELEGPSQFNVISVSSISGFTGAWFANDSFDTITNSFLFGQYSAGGGIALQFGGSTNSSVSLSTITTSDPIRAALDLYGPGGANNSVTQSYIYNGLGDGVRDGVSAAPIALFTLSRSTVIALGSNSIGIYLNGVASATVTGSLVQASTAVYLSGSSATLISQCNLVATGYGASFDSGSSSNTISLSSVATTANGGFAAITINGVNNTISQSIVNSITSGAGSGNHGIDMAGADGSIITGSTITLNNGSSEEFGSGIRVLNGANVSISKSFVRNNSGVAAALWVDFPTGPLTIDQSTFTNTGYLGLNVGTNYPLTLSNSYVQGSTAVFISIQASDPSNAINLSNDVLIGTSTTGGGFWLTGAGGGINLALTISSSVIRAGSGGAGIFLDSNNQGTVNLSSDTFIGGRYAVALATQTAGASLSIFDLMIQGPLTAGATAINILGGTFVSTFTGVQFNDPNIAVNVNARPISSTSRITMAGYSGVKGGPTFENDPASKVDWVGANMPAGCVSGYNVKQGGGGDYTTIQTAVNALGNNLLGDTCVVIRDTQTYTEQVTIQGFTNNGYQLKIIADPSFVSSAPAVNPPAASTAAFRIMNASVTLQNISIVPSNPVPYGIAASSSYVTLSSVTLNDPLGSIDFAGIAIASFSVVINSSMTSPVGGHVNTDLAMIEINGTLNLVSYATMTTVGNNGEGIRVRGSSNTLQHLYLWGSNVAYGNSIVTEDYTDNTTIDDLTILGWMQWGGSSNTITNSRFFGAASNSAIFYFPMIATYATLSNSTFTAFGQAMVVGDQDYPGFAYSVFRNIYIDGTGFPGSPGLDLSANGNGVGHNLVDQVTVHTVGALFAARITVDAADTVSNSTFTNIGGLGLWVVNTTSLTLTNTYVQGSTAVYIAGSTNTIIDSSVLITTFTADSGLVISSGSTGVTLTNDVIAGGAQGAAILLAQNNMGAINLSTNVVRTGRYGLYIATQSAGATISITSMTIQGPLTAGATAINFAGGTFVSTFTSVVFNDANIAIDVNGAPLSGASRVTMLNYAGAKGGPAFEDDPSSVVDWTIVITTNIPPTNPVPLPVMISSITVVFGGVGADAYTAQASTASDFSGNVSSAGAFAAGSLTISGLIANTTYFLRVGSVWGPATFYANTTPASIPTLAAPPSPLAITSIGLNQFTVLWPANGNPPGTTYRADISTDINFGTISVSSITTVLASTFTSLSSQTTYYVRVTAINVGGVPSAYAQGAVITVNGLITISANRLPGVWYNLASSIFFAQGAAHYHYKIALAPAVPAISDPAFDGSGLNVPLLQGGNYFSVLGTNASDTVIIGTATFGPVDVDTGSPVVASIAAQISATDTTPIPNGGTTVATSPRFTWPAAVSLSPIVGYSLSMSTNPADIPGAAITTTINFIDKILSASGLYYIKVSAMNLAGTLGPPVGMNFTFTTTPSFDNILLKSNYINPLRGGCSELDIFTSQSGRIKAQIYTLLGQRVATLMDSEGGPGVFTFKWCGQNLANEMVASGVYILHVEAPGQKKNFKIGVLK